jgi:L-seryl-tRNA(Ser) seleniumtransferase
LSELARLAHDAGLLLYEDAGSGALVDLSGYGLEGEPVISESIRGGADVVTFSGDKLMGGAQAGIIVGRGEIIERLGRHPLYRAMRADKLALAALQATLEIYRRGAQLQEIPVLQTLSLTPEELEKRARSFLSKSGEQLSLSSLRLEIIEGESAIGGGAAPTAHLRTFLIALSHDSLSPDELGQALRRGEPPVVARIAEDRVLLDLRTVAEDEEAELLQALASMPAA